MGLRLTDGIRRKDLRRELGATPEALYARERLEALVSAGYLTLNPDGLRVTPAGRHRLDAVIAHLLS